MELIFPITKIQPQKSLKDKMVQLHLDPFLHRIIVNVEFLNQAKQVIFITEAILDTGAPFSLFSSEILALLEPTDLIPHTVYGIVNRPECQLGSQLGKINIQLRDSAGQTTPIIPIFAAFYEEDSLPNLLGLKGLLELSNLEITIDKDNFTFRIREK